ncbi:ATP-dependent Clp protease proteolytic subunit [Patescibacteria group bacterium]|nr:ATP-dependent Clp protease proteolytic subunit [Patescibacteria group bacterium]
MKFIKILLTICALNIGGGMATAQEQSYCDQYFYGIIDQDTVGMFIDKVLLDECDAGSQLRVFISSAGGDPQAAMGLYDWLQLLEADTVAMGDVASAAVPLFLAGKVRTALPNARFLIHPGYTFVQEKMTDRDFAELKERDAWDDEMYNRIIAERTGLERSKVDKMVDPFTVFGVDEAKEWGFITQASLN